MQHCAGTGTRPRQGPGLRRPGISLLPPHRSFFPASSQTADRPPDYPVNEPKLPVIRGGRSVQDGHHPAGHWNQPAGGTHHRQARQGQAGQRHAALCLARADRDADRGPAGGREHRHRLPVGSGPAGRVRLPVAGGRVLRRQCQRGTADRHADAPARHAGVLLPQGAWPLSSGPARHPQGRAGRHRAQAPAGRGNPAAGRRAGSRPAAVAHRRPGARPAGGSRPPVGRLACAGSGLPADRPVA